MADVVTRTELEDAHVDLQTIEDVVNGAPDLNGDGVVTSRLGREIKTLARLEKDYPSGGIIQFDTAAEMNANLCYKEGTIAWVTNDTTPANNIGYTKIGDVGAGEWEPFSDSPMTALYEDVAEIRAIVETTPEEGFAVAGQNGTVVFQIGGNGRVRCVGIDTRTVAVGEGGVLSEATAGSDVVESLEDSDGKAIRYVTSDGIHRIVEVQTKRFFSDVFSSEKLISRRPVIRSSEDRMDWAAPLAEVVHVAYYGQSWSLGFDSAVSTTTQRHNTVTFNTLSGVPNSGVAQQYAIADRADALQSFIPAIERGGLGGSPELPMHYLGETGAVAMGHAFWDLAEFENNLDWKEHGVQLLISACGEGSKQIEPLADPSGPYLSRLKEQILRGYTIAQAEGKSYVFAAFTWLQGSGASISEYPAQMEAMRAHIDAYAKSVTGQTWDVRLITWQMYPFSNVESSSASAKNVLYRFVEAADTYEYIVCAGPSYQYPQVSATNIHFTSAGSIGIGAQFGQALKRVLIDGAKYRPLRPTLVERNGRIVLVRLNVGSSGSLVIDTDAVSECLNSGLDIIDASGSPISISNVGIIGPGTIKIVCASNIPDGCSIRAAATGTDATNSGKWRTNVRDNAGDYGGVHRWLVAGVWPISN